ncbi:MAG: DUF222 domain-containing protein, partial [Lysobacterales bacterium]
MQNSHSGTHSNAFSPDSLSRPSEFPCPEYFESLERLGDEISELSAHLDAGTYQLLELIGRFDEHGGWHGTGIHSCAHWLNWRCGMNLGAARERVRTARALPGLPLISAAFREGRISYSKARAMTRVATAKNEDALLTVALCGTASHVEKQVRLYRRHQRSEALVNENQRFIQRELTWYVDDDGSWVFKGRFTPEQGALINAALQSAMEQVFQEQKNVSHDVSIEISRRDPLDKPIPVPVASRRADAMERLAMVFLNGAEKAGSGGDHYVVNIHTDIETLKADGERAESDVEAPGHSDSGHVSAETSRRLSCDCSVVHWLERDNGEPLNVGRKTRTIPPAIRRALQRRDRGCRFPGCTCTRFVDAHHVVHWADGGETSMENLALLCRRHHRLVHEEGFGLTTNAQGDFRFSLPNGQPIPE